MKFYTKNASGDVVCFDSKHTFAALSETEMRNADMYARTMRTDFYRLLAEGEQNDFRERDAQIFDAIQKLHSESLHCDASTYDAAKLEKLQDDFIALERNVAIVCTAENCDNFERAREYVKEILRKVAEYKKQQESQENQGNAGEQIVEIPPSVAIVEA